MEDQESVIGESGVVQEKRKEPVGLIRGRSKPGKLIIMVTSILLAAAIIIVSLIVFNVIGVGKQARAGSIESIVILPFGNYTGVDTLDPNIEGMHSSLINAIGEKTGLRVIGRVSSNLYKNTDKSIKQIVKELKVDAAMEVDISCLGDSVCWHTRLMSGGPQEKQLWMGDYRDAKGNLFNMFNRVIKQIAGEVKISLSTAQEAMLAESSTIDPEAIDAYLKGYSYVDDMSPEPLIKARDYLNRAIEKDPDWAPLYAAMATVWFTMGSMGAESPEIAIPIVYEYLNKALELDPDLADAHYISAVLAYTVEMNWEKAEKEFLKALAINPNNALSRMHYSFMLYILQRPEEAKIQADLAYELDPLNTIVQSTYGLALLCGGDCASALSVLENIVASDPDNFLAYNYIHPAAFQCGDLDKVFEADKHMLPLEEEAINEIEKIYNKRGFYEAYEEITRQLEILAEKVYIAHTDMAFRYYIINQDDKAIEWIEKAAEIGEPSIAWIGTGIWNITRLYDNPRFIEVLKKLNLPLPKSD